MRRSKITRFEFFGGPRDGAVERYQGLNTIPDVYAIPHAVRTMLHVYRRSLCGCEPCSANRRRGIEVFAYFGSVEKGTEITFPT